MEKFDKKRGYQNWFQKYRKSRASSRDSGIRWGEKG